MFTGVAECSRNGGYGCHRGSFVFEDVPFVEFVCLVFTRRPGERDRRRFRSLWLCPLLHVLGLPSGVNSLC